MARGIDDLPAAWQDRKLTRAVVESSFGRAFQDLDLVETRGEPAEHRQLRETQHKAAPGKTLDVVIAGCALAHGHRLDAWTLAGAGPGAGEVTYKTAASAG